MTGPSGDAAATAGGGKTLSPPNQNDRIEELLDGIENIIGSLNTCLVRTHEKLHGEYQFAPRPESDSAPESSGRMGMFEIRLKNHSSQLQLTLEVAESLEGMA